MEPYNMFKWLWLQNKIDQIKWVFHPFLCLIYFMRQVECLDHRLSFCTPFPLASLCCFVLQHPHLWVCTFECSLLIGHGSFLVVPSSKIFTSKILTPMQSLFPLRRSNKLVDKVMSLDTIMMEGNNWKMMMLK